MTVGRSLITAGVMGVLWLYRNCLSPLKPQCCRFHPTCSAYARDAVAVHGVWRGGWLTLRRLSRCHPLYRGSPEDPVPLSKPSNAHHSNAADSRENP